MAAFKPGDQVTCDDGRKGKVLVTTEHGAIVQFELSDAEIAELPIGAPYGLPAFKNDFIQFAKLRPCEHVVAPVAPVEPSVQPEPKKTGKTVNVFKPKGGPKP